MSVLDIQQYVTETADSRGRVNVGVGRADKSVTYVVLDPDTLDRLGGPNTKRVQSDGRLSIGSKYADDELTIGIIAPNE